MFYLYAIKEISLKPLSPWEVNKDQQNTKLKRKLENEDEKEKQRKKKKKEFV